MAPMKILESFGGVCPFLTFKWQVLVDVNSDLIFFDALRFVRKAKSWYAISLGKHVFYGKRGFKNGTFFSFLVVFCFHNTKCPGVFLHLAMVAAGVITDFKIFSKYVRDTRRRWSNMSDTGLTRAA
jgi:hypothetical protein